MKMWILIPALAGMMAAGCSKSPQTFGDELSTRGDKAADIGKQWNESNENVAEGHKLMEKGQVRVDDARKEQAEAQKVVEEGRQQVKAGKQQMLNSEGEYLRMRATAVTPPEHSPPSPDTQVVIKPLTQPAPAKATATQ